MGKHILILTGSPRKGGNSRILAEAFAGAARAKGHEITVVHAAERKIGPCRACERCWTDGIPCVQRDGMQELYPLLNVADAVVFAGPLYFFGLSAQLKAVIDRFYPLCKDDKLDAFSGKQSALLLCGASEEEDDYDGAIRSYELTCDYLGWEDCGVVAARGLDAPGEVNGTAWIEQAKELAARF